MPSTQIQSINPLSQKQPIIFWGATNQAKMLKECLLYTDYELVALFDHNDKLESPFAHIPIFHNEDLFIEWINKNHTAKALSGIVAIGGARGEIRFKIQKKLEHYGIKPITLKHPTAHVAHNAVIGKGCHILPQACINVEARLGEACIINSGAIIEHECVLGNGVHIAPGACLTGEVKVGDFATVFAGSTIIPKITIGEGAVVGAGSVVIRDVPPYSVVVGSPGRVIKELIPSSV